ncbi:MAG: putative lipid II flippase FtsW [Deltaproteobacteria bacterium]|nr:MAG: putative lipid II flippase FtsW [Deltaproteobacteria bacterium]
MFYGLKRDEIVLMSVVGTLLCLGLLMVFNASSIKAFNAYGQSSHYLLRQLIFAILGGAALFLCARFDYHWWSKLTLPLVVVSIGLLVLVLVPGFGVNIKGATRWIKTPLFNLQVSEFCKLSFVIYLSVYLAKREGQLGDFKRDFLPPWIILGVVIVLLMLEPDFGSSVVLGALTFVLLFVAGARLKHLAILLAIGAAGVAVAIAGRGYRMDRVTSFLDVGGKGVSYQLKQSLIAYGAGGVQGVGAGNSVQKQLYLPEAYTDFIVAVWGEEFGFVGVIVLVVLIAALLWIGLKISRSAPDRLGSILAFGLTLFLVLQMTINFWVTLGLLPTKGLTFPFLSYGGSSLCVSLAAVGVLLNVSRQTR